MKLIIRILANSLAVYVTAKIVSGINLDSFTTALVFSIVLGVLNAIIKPVLVILTLPVTILTLGLFTLVINAFIVVLAASIVPGVHIDSFFSAILFSIVLSVVGWFLGLLAL